jgi:hypothetical protein
VAKNILQHWKLADLDSQYVRKLEGHLNRKGGKMRIQPITLNQIAFGHFLSQSFHKGVI